MIGSFYYY